MRIMFTNANECYEEWCAIHGNSINGDANNSKEIENKEIEEFTIIINKLIEDNNFNVDFNMFIKICEHLATVIKEPKLQQVQSNDPYGQPVSLLIDSLPDVQGDSLKNYSCQVFHSSDKEFGDLRQELANPKDEFTQRPLSALIKEHSLILHDNAPRTIKDCGKNFNLIMRWCYSFGDKKWFSKPYEFTLYPNPETIKWEITSEGELKIYRETKGQAQLKPLQMVLKSGFGYLGNCAGEQSGEIIWDGLSKTNTTCQKIKKYNKEKNYQLFIKDDALAKKYCIKRKSALHLSTNEFNLSLRCPYCFHILDQDNPSFINNESQGSEFSDNASDEEAALDIGDPIDNAGNQIRGNQQTPEKRHINTLSNLNWVDRFLFRRGWLPNNITYVCPHCKKYLPADIFKDYKGTMAIELVGLRNSGKSSYLSAITKHMTRLGNTHPNDDKTLRKVISSLFNNRVGIREKATSPDKFPNHVSTFSYTYEKYNEKNKILLSFVDPAGEQFNPLNERLNNQNEVENMRFFLQNANGLIFFIDPCACESFREAYMKLEEIRKSEQEAKVLISKIKDQYLSNDNRQPDLSGLFTNIVGNLRYEQRLEKINIPLAIVISKFDLLKASSNEIQILKKYNNEYANIFVLSSHEIFTNNRELSEEVRNALIKSRIRLIDDYNSFIQSAEENFQEVQYFGISSGYHTIEDAPPNNAIRSFDPIDWFLSCNALQK